MVFCFRIVRRESVVGSEKAEVWIAERRKRVLIDANACFNGRWTYTQGTERVLMELGLVHFMELAALVLADVLLLRLDVNESVVLIRQQIE